MPSRQPANTQGTRHQPAAATARREAGAEQPSTPDDTNHEGFSRLATTATLQGLANSGVA